MNSHPRQPQQFGRVFAQRDRNPQDVDERDVFLTAFDLPHVGAVQVALLAEILLASRN